MHVLYTMQEGLEDTLGGRTGKHKASYRELWDKLVRESASGGLLRADGETFLEIVSNFSIALSMSAVREFRRVGTATAAQIATSLLHVAATLEDGRSTAEAQLEAEEGRKGKAAADRAAAFKRQRDEAIAAISSIKTHVDSIFQSVFSIRFRDIDTEIRAIVVDAIGRWMMLFPSVYLTANYLKYVAWALSDKEASVRMVAANALLTLYSSAQNPTQLRDFTDRFRGRFAELVYDKEDAVAVAGVRLVTLLVRLEHLPVTAGAKLYRLMSDVSPAIRAAAAELAAGMLKHLGAKALAEAAGGAGAKPGAKGKKGRSKPAANATASGQSDEEVELAGVLYVLRVLASQQLTAEKNEEDEEDRAPRKKGDGDDEAIDDEAGPLAEGAVERVISALVDRSPALRNWQLMVNWLKEDTAATLFGDAAAQDLAVCLATALHTATAEPAAGAGRRPGARDKAAAARNAARQDATLVLQKELQVLIRKFQSEPAMVAAVVRLVPQLKLEVFSLRRQEKSLGSLLAAVKDVMFKHADVNVAAACSSALEKCATTGPDTTRDAARAVLGECIAASAAELDKAATGLEEAGARELKSAWEAYISSNGEEESAVLFAARAAALRAAALAEAYPTGVQASDKARGALTRMLEVAAGVAVLPAPIIYHAGRAALLVLITDLSHITKEEPDVAALGDLAAGVSAFAEALEGIVAAAGAADEDHVTEAVAALHADFMLVFSAENLPPALQPTAYRPSDAVVESFWEGIHAAMLQRPVRG